MIASASVARFDGLFRSSERSIHIVGIRNLFIISRDLRDYCHIHPRQEEDGTFTITTILPREGRYEIVCDFFPVGGTPQLIRQTLVTERAENSSSDQQANVVPSPELSKSVDGVRFNLAFDPRVPAAGTPVVKHL